MNKTPAEIRFENSRKKLSQALKNLEEVVKKKLHELAQSKVLNSSQNDEKNLGAKIIEQDHIIESLNSEINNLQENLAELGKETEFLSAKNKAISERISENKPQQSGLIQALEADLIRIEEIIKSS